MYTRPTITHLKERLAFLAEHESSDATLRHSAKIKTVINHYIALLEGSAPEAPDWVMRTIHLVEEIGRLEISHADKTFRDVTWFIDLQGGDAQALLAHKKDGSLDELSKRMLMRTIEALPTSCISGALVRGVHNIFTTKNDPLGRPVSYYLGKEEVDIL